MIRKHEPQPFESFLQDISEVGGWLWEKGWAERNGGNLSVNITDMYEGDVRSYGGRFVKIQFPKEAARMLIFITGTGCRLRDLVGRTEEVSAIIRVNNHADGYSICWGGKSDNFAPTSEMITHINIHVDRKKKGSNKRAIVHTHPTELMCLSHHPDWFNNEELLNKKLWCISPETRVFVPRGVGIVPYMLPGSADLAVATVAKLEERDVVLWKKHGALSVAENIKEAFDMIDVVNKAAVIQLMALQAGFEPVGLSAEEMGGLEQFIS